MMVLLSCSTRTGAWKVGLREMMLFACRLFFSVRCFQFSFFFFFSSRRRHTRWNCDWSSDVCSSDLLFPVEEAGELEAARVQERSLAFLDAAEIVRHLAPGAGTRKADGLIERQLQR